MTQRDMFEPERLAELDQFFTPSWIARRAARWIPRGVTVLEPSVGSGNLVEGLVLAGHDPRSVIGCELDPRWVAFAKRRISGLVVHEGDFLTSFHPAILGFGASLQNPPYAGDLDLRFVARALELLEPEPYACVVAILKADFEYSSGRAPFWNALARVRRRAQLVERPRFGAHVDGKEQGGAERNYVVLELVPRARPRQPGDVELVLEERWSRTDPEPCWTSTFAFEVERRGWREVVRP